MNLKELSISEFSSQIAQQLQNNKYKSVGFDNINKFPLVKNKQGLYVLNWKETKLTYARGIKEMLGYDRDEFTMDLVLNSVHPDDYKFVNRIVKGIVTHSVKNDIFGEGQYLKVTYRLRKKDGTYIKVLRISTPHEIDNQSKLVSNFSLLTDISFISNNDKVDWDLFTNDLDIEGFKQNVFREFLDFFTKRELQVINFIKRGFSSKLISKELFLSYHTILTHRKNIMRKSRCHNVQELLEFCRKNGII